MGAALWAAELRMSLKLLAVLYVLYFMEDFVSISSRPSSGEPEPWGLLEMSPENMFHSTQDVVLMRAHTRDMNLPKFVFEDVPLFPLGLISDLCSLD